MQERLKEQALVAQTRRRLEAEYGLALPEDRLSVGRKADGTPRQHRFDLVAPDRSFVGEVRTYTLGEGGNRPAGKFAHCYAACLFLYRIKARRRVLVLTDHAFWARFRRESDGVVEGIAIIYAPGAADAPIVTDLPVEPAPSPTRPPLPVYPAQRRPVSGNAAPPRRNRGGPGPAGRRPNTGPRNQGRRS